MRQSFFTPLLAATFIAALLSAASQASAASTLHGDVGRGSNLAHRWCGSCHLLVGEKRAGDIAPPFREIARNPKMGPDEWRALLSRPHGPMPPITLSRQEIEDLIAYLGYLKEH